MSGGFGLFAGLIALGSPLFLVLLATAVVLLCFASHMPFEVLPQILFGGMDSSVFIAVPLYLLTGFLITASGASHHLIRFLESLFGHWIGGLALVTVLTSVVFAGITGSSTADAVAIGGIMVPALIDAGYSKRFASGLVAAAGTLGIMFPPSIPLILYGAISQTSITKLFAAAVVPGFLIAALLIVVVMILSFRGNYRRARKASWAERVALLPKAIPVLILPVIIRGGIDAGIFTPSEAAAVAVLYAFALGIFVYRTTTWRSLYDSLRSTAHVTAMIMMIIAASVLLGFYLIQNQAPQHLTEYLIARQPSGVVFLLVANLLLIVLGFFLEPPAIIYLTVPLLLPALAAFHVDPIHFAIIMMLNMSIGLIHPPVGLNLFVIAGIARQRVEDVAIGVLPFLAAIAVALAIVTFVPAVSLALTQHVR
ncbi:MAG: TRAP transporter large permease subunit [Candidatus Velthaea sp.]